MTLKPLVATLAVIGVSVSFVSTVVAQDARDALLVQSLHPSNAPPHHG